MDKAGWGRLMGDFVAGRIDGPAFERRFLEAFRAQPDDAPMPYAADLAFYAVDAYCADPTLRGPEDIDENQLRAEVRQYLARLDEPWPEVAGTEQRNRQLERWTTALGMTAPGDGLKGKS